MNSRSRKLVKYVVPTILSSLSIFLFSIIDGIFVGRGVGTDALGAVNLAFPFIMIFNALVMLFTIGGLTITAIRYGRNDEKGANQAFMHSIVMAGLISAVFALAGLFLTRPLLRLMGASEYFMDQASDYLFWYAVFMLPCGPYYGLNGFVRTDGDPVLVSASVIISSGLNIVLDWLFIFPLKMGLKGAAIATGLAQLAGFFVVLVHFFKKKGILRFRPQPFDKRLMKLILLRGLPECIAQFGVPLTTIIMNTLLTSYIGETAVNVYSILAYTASFAVSIFMGTAEGIQPLFGISYGAKDEEDLKFYLRAGLWISFVGSTFITLAVILLRAPICTLFGAEGVTRQMTIEAMPLYAWGFIIESVNVIISGYLYSTTRTRQALIANVLRSLVFNSLVTILMPKLFGPQSLWLTFGVYEILVLIVSVILLKRADKNGAIQGDNE